MPDSKGKAGRQERESRRQDKRAEENKAKKRKE